MLVVSFSHHFLSYLSNGSAHHSFGGGSIQVKLAYSPPFLLGFIVVDQLSVLEDPFGDLHSIEKTSLSVGFVHQPFSLVESSITPKHLPVSMSQIRMIVAFVDIAVTPCVYSVTLLSILGKLAFVFLIGTALPPNPVPMFLPIHELPLVKTSVPPVELSKTMKSSILVVSLIKIPSNKFLSPLPIFDKTNERTLVSTRIGLSKDAETRRRSLCPLPHVAVTLRIDPHPASVFEVIAPLTLVGLSVWVDVLALPMHFVLEIFALIDTPIGENLNPLAMPLIGKPIPIIPLPTVVQHDAFSLPLALEILPVIDSFLVLFQFELRGLVERRHVEEVRGKLLERLVELLV